jgi:Flp pilus assembly protein TadD
MRKTVILIPAIILLTILVLVTFWESFDNNFVDWDDYTYVVDNNLVRNPEETTLKEVFTKTVSLNYHPLTILTLRWNNNKCSNCPEGISPAPFIRWNVIIHILNTLLVFILIYFLSKKKVLVAFIVAALFGVHPMHVESVAWISERKDVLYTFFFLSGLITYIKYLNVTDNNKKKYIWLAATFALFVISCLSKAMAVVFPLVLLLIKFWQYQPTGNNQVKESIKETISLKNIIPLIPFFVTSLIFGIVAISINKLNTFTILHRIQFATYGFLMYIVKFFFPGNQLAIYPYPSQAEYDTATIGLLLKLAPFAFILLSVLVAYSLRKTKLFVFGMGFFLVTIIMVLQLISVGVAIMADRYTYLPYIGLAFIPAMLIGDKVMLKRIPIFVFTCVFIIVMIFLARRQTSVWRNSETLWSKVIDKYPAMETARSIRGIYWEKKAEKAPNAQTQNYFEDKAFEDFKIAIKAGTPRADVYEGAGCIYGKWGDLNNALFCFNNAIRLKPQKGSAYFNRALTLSKLNNNEGAIKDYNLALVYQPQRALQILTNRYILFLSTGKFKEATRDLDYLISVDGNNFIFYYNRAQARTQLNDIQGAISDYKKVLTLQPNDQMSKTELQKLLKK